MEEISGTSANPARINPQKRVLVGMSGGLDSTYSVIKLRDAGYYVEGAVLEMHNYTDVDGALDSARQLCVPINVIDCKKLFADNVVPYFISEYVRGRTPNPCVVCNPTVKIAALCEYAEQNGFDYAATGHYARIVKNENGRLCVARAGDEKKDQSYALYRLTQKLLSRLLFPLGGEHKEGLREEARKLSLHAADKRESQEICFIPDGDYASFIEKRTGKTFPQGDYIDEDGKVLGRHKGIIHYTVGQRKGLNISLGRPMFVTRIDADSNTVTLAPAGGEYTAAFDVSSLVFSGMTEEEAGTGELSLCVKHRYLARPEKCAVSVKNGVAHIVPEHGMRAVTPGQSAVFYLGDAVMFGGFIV